MKLAVLHIATNKYMNFIDPLVTSIHEHFKLPNWQIDNFVFTNIMLPKDYKKSQYTPLEIQNLPWPLITLMRFHFFLQYKHELESYDHIFYIDADSLVVDDIHTDEIIFDGLTVTHHAGMYNRHPRECTYEWNPKSTACPKKQIGPYVIGANFGGKAEYFWQLCEKAKENINADLKNNYIAVFHDESHLNNLIYNDLSHIPLKHLGVEYNQPTKWDLPFKPKIVSITKDEEGIRS